MGLSWWSQIPLSELEELPPSFVASLPISATSLLWSPRVSEGNSSLAHAGWDPGSRWSFCLASICSHGAEGWREHSGLSGGSTPAQFLSITLDR